MSQVRAIVADDAALWRQSVVRILEEAGVLVVAEVADAEALTAAADRERPDIAIVDVRMPPTMTDDGLRGALWIRRSLPGVGVMVLCQNVHPGPPLDLLGVGEGGVGYLLKDRVTSASHLVGAVLRVAAGGSAIDPLVTEQLLRHRGGGGDPLEELSARELEVLKLVAAGHSNQDIADELVVTLKTVEAHVHSVLQKLGLQSDAAGNRRVHAVLAYLKARGGLTPEGAEAP